MLLFWVTVIVVSVFVTSHKHSLSPLTSQLVIVIFTYAATYIWFMEDVKDTGLIPSKALILGVVTAASICVPYYLVRYKGMKRALLSATRFTGLFIFSACLLGVIM